MSAGAMPVPWGGLGGGATAGAVGETAGMALGRLLGPLSLIFFPSPLGDGTLTGNGIDISTMPTQSQTLPQTQTRAQPRAQTRTCDPTNNKDCRKPPQTHSGRVQAQEDKITYIPAAVSGSAWTDLSTPPNLAMCTGFAYNCRKALYALQGADRGKSFQTGADVAYQNLINWMKSKSPMGVSVMKISFYFDGDKGQPNNKRRDKNGKNSRRIDFDVLKGEALKG